MPEFPKDKPSTLDQLEFATAPGAPKTIPDASKRLNGWASKDPLPHENHNWQSNAWGDNIQWLAGNAVRTFKNLAEVRLAGLADRELFRLYEPGRSAQYLELADTVDSTKQQHRACDGEFLYWAETGSPSIKRYSLQDGSLDRTYPIDPAETVVAICLSSTKVIALARVSTGLMKVYGFVKDTGIVETLQLASNAVDPNHRYTIAATAAYNNDPRIIFNDETGVWVGRYLSSGAAWSYINHDADVYGVAINNQGIGFYAGLPSGAGASYGSGQVCCWVDANNTVVGTNADFGIITPALRVVSNGSEIYIVSTGKVKKYSFGAPKQLKEVVDQENFIHQSVGAVLSTLNLEWGVAHSRGLVLLDSENFPVHYDRELNLIETGFYFAVNLTASDAEVIVNDGTDASLINLPLPVRPQLMKKEDPDSSNSTSIYTAA